MKRVAKFLPSSCGFAALLALSTGSVRAVSEVSSPEAVDWIRTHRLSEEEFMSLSREPGTIILDTSVRETYRWLHIASAVHLAHREMNADSLGKVLPDKNARILLYENNNYRAFVKHLDTGDSNEVGIPFAGDWSGDVEHTCQILREHGYLRIYALASYVRIDRGSLPLVASMSAVDLGKPVALSLNSAPPGGANR